MGADDPVGRHQRRPGHDGVRTEHSIERIAGKRQRFGCSGDVDEFVRNDRQTEGFPNQIHDGPRFDAESSDCAQERKLERTGRRDHHWLGLKTFRIPHYYVFPLSLEAPGAKRSAAFSQPYLRLFRISSSSRYEPITQSIQ